MSVSGPRNPRCPKHDLHHGDVINDKASIPAGRKKVCLPNPSRLAEFPISRLQHLPRPETLPHAV